MSSPPLPKDQPCQPALPNRLRARPEWTPTRVAFPRQKILRIDADYELPRTGQNSLPEGRRLKRSGWAEALLGRGPEPTRARFRRKVSPVSPRGAAQRGPRHVAGVGGGGGGGQDRGKGTRPRLGGSASLSPHAPARTCPCGGCAPLTRTTASARPPRSDIALGCSSACTAWGSARSGPSASTARW